MRGRARRMAIPSSSASSRLKAASSLSPASILPPGNSQRPARCLPGGRSAIRTHPLESYSAAATTRIVGRAPAPCSLDTREHAVAVLVFLSRSARARLVTADLALDAHESTDRL